MKTFLVTFLLLDCKPGFSNDTGKMSEPWEITPINEIIHILHTLHLPWDGTESELREELRLVCVGR